MAKRYLQLANGRVFAGEAFGAPGETVGELVFTTGMVGYIEALSDPRCHGQIIVQTYPLSGNYGMIAEDMASDRMHARAYVVREICDTPSNYRCAGGLDSALREQGVVGISGVDTRSLTLILRKCGSMPARITDTLPADTDKAWADSLPAVSIADVALTEVHTYAPAGATVGCAALIDCGCGASLARAMAERGIAVTAYPPTATAEEILTANPALLAVSDGPMDPRNSDPAADPVIDLLRALAGKIPAFGVGLGHLLMAIAMGAKVCRLEGGHRGSNLPVKYLVDGTVAITSQNHGHAVDAATLPAGAVCTHINVNDGSCAGVAYPGKSACSVQFDPAEAEFARMISAIKEAAIHAL